MAATLAAIAETAGRPLRVVDLGGGTGGRAVDLARRGHDVLVVDRSADALAMLDQRASAAGVAARIDKVQADVSELGAHVADGEVDLVLCHGILEVVDDPAALLAAVARALRPGGHASILAAGRLRSVLARALAGDLVRARRLLALDAEGWDRTVDGPRRYVLVELVALIESEGLLVESADGVRVLADLVPRALVESEADRQALLSLEEAAAADHRLRELAGALHVIARA
ncbi:methyltransferase domain-containing protein [Mumia sp. ZJ1417]|nr:methyltransferase domain-containing protein [Mumia sp. ZJ1417]